MGFILATFADISVATALVGVCFHSLSSGLGELTFLSYSADFSTDGVSMWSSGTGFAGVTGSGLYMLLISVCGASDKTVLYSFCGLPILMLEAFALSNSKMSPGQVTLNDEDNKDDVLDVMTFKEKMTALEPILPMVISLVLVYFSEYTIN